MIKPYYQDDNVVIYNGNCLDVLPEISGVTACVTDPPYGLNFMGKGWDHGVPGVRYWELALVACLPGAPLMAFGGTRTVHRLVCAIEDAGWEIRDGIEYLHWLYGSGFPKSLDISKAIDKAAGAKRTDKQWIDRFHDGGTRQDTFRNADGRFSQGTKGNFTTAPATEAAKRWEGYGTALKPAHEPICLAMKPIEGTFAQNALTYGVAGLNIDGGRIKTDELAGKIYRNKGDALTWGGTYGKGTVSGNTQGRWPANIIHDGSPEVLALFPVTTVCGGPKKTTHDVGMFGIGQPGQIYNKADGDNNSAARFFYCAKASKAERGQDNNHPTVKPLALMRYLLTLVTMPEKNLILDPFMGSGSTLVAAKRMGLKAIGVDNDEGSCEIAVKRLEQDAYIWEEV